MCTSSAGEEGIQPNGLSRSGGFEEPILGRWTESMRALELVTEGRVERGELRMKLARDGLWECNPGSHATVTTYPANGLCQIWRNQDQVVHIPGSRVS